MTDEYNDHADVTLADRLEALSGIAATQSRIPPAADLRRRGHRRSLARRAVGGVLSVAVLVGIAVGVTGLARHDRAPATTTAPSPRVPGDPDRIVPGAWVPDDQAPFVYRKSGRPGWNVPPADPSSGTSIVDAPSQVTYSCEGAHDETWTATGVVKVQERDYEAGLSVPQATQELFFYRDEATARSAFATIAGWYRSCNPGDIADDTTELPLTTSVTEKATIGDGMAWLHTMRQPDGSPGAPGGGFASDTREYFVQRGNVIAYISLTGGPEVSAMDGDKSLLERMAQHLCVYGGAC